MAQWSIEGSRPGWGGGGGLKLLTLQNITQQLNSGVSSSFQQLSQQAGFSLSARQYCIMYLALTLKAYSVPVSASLYVCLMLLTFVSCGLHLSLAAWICLSHQSLLSFICLMKPTIVSVCFHLYLQAFLCHFFTTFSILPHKLWKPPFQLPRTVSHRFQQPSNTLQ